MEENTVNQEEEIKETIQTDDKKMKPEKAKRSGSGIVLGVILGMLLGVLITFLGIVLYRGYVAVPIGRYGTLTLKLPYYDKMHLKDEGAIDKVELDRKMEEIDHLIVNNYMYNADPQKQMDGMFAGMLYGLTEDSYAKYYSKEEYENESKAFNGSYVGIGVTVSKEEETGAVLVEAVAENGPAKVMGIQIGDRIVEANGEDLRGYDLNGCVQRITGPEGTEVTLKILRDGQEIMLNVMRKKIVDISVRGQLIGNTKIGYISITGFTPTTEEEFEEVLDDVLNDYGAEGVIFDVRNNGGGDMNVAIRMLDSVLSDDLKPNVTGTEDLPQGKKTLASGTEDSTMILSVEDKKGNYVEYHACDGFHEDDVPMVVLVNENSASASEIFAGVFQSYGYQVVGTKTFGKGIVQTLYTLKDKSAVKFTTDRYRLPNGELIHGKGIEPDVQADFVEFDEVKANQVNYANGEAVELEKDAQLLAAKKAIMDAIGME